MNVLGMILFASAVLAPAHVADPLSVLHRWDARRAAAFVAGDPVLLSGLYAPGSAALGTDLATMHAYDRRGLRVTAVSPQVRAYEVLDRAPGRVRLRVTGTVSASAVDGRHCLRLPSSPVSTRDLTLRREAGAWVMVSVRDRDVRQHSG